MNIIKINGFNHKNIGVDLLILGEMNEHIHPIENKRIPI